MQLFVPCTGCGNQVPTQEFQDGIPGPQTLTCEACGQEFLWDSGTSWGSGTTEDGNEVTEFSMTDMPEIPRTHANIERTDLDSVAIEAPKTTVDMVEESIQPAFKLELELDESEQPEESEERVEPGFTEAMNSEQPSGLDWSILGPDSKRRRPQEVSAIRKILPPILGGLAAFPIATLIMWYGFGKDIGSTGPTVAEYLPWVVPEKLRNTPWQFGRRASSDDSSFNNTSPRSNFRPPRSFPSLNRESSVVDSPEKNAENVETSKTDSQPDTEPSKSNEPPVPKPSISETISKLRAFQKEWNNTPKSERTKMVGAYYSEMIHLSEQSAELKGRSATVWRKELESISREILSHPNIPLAIQLGAIGALPGVVAARPDDFVATVITISNDNESTPNASWLLQEKWSSGTADIPIEIRPGAWRAGVATLPATCLVLGKLATNEGSETNSSAVVLIVHALLPE